MVTFDGSVTAIIPDKTGGLLFVSSYYSNTACEITSTQAPVCFMAIHSSPTLLLLVTIVLTPQVVPCAHNSMINACSNVSKFSGIPLY